MLKYTLTNTNIYIINEIYIYISLYEFSIILHSETNVIVEDNNRVPPPKQKVHLFFFIDII